MADSLMTEGTQNDETLHTGDDVSEDESFFNSINSIDAKLDKTGEYCDPEEEERKRNKQLKKQEENNSFKSSQASSTPEDHVKFADTSYATNLMSCFDDLRKRSLFTDVILAVAGKEFPAHRVVLVSGSEYFRKMFCTDHRASKQMMVQITGLSFDVMEMLLSYFYTSRITITKSNVKLLLQASELFQVYNLRSACIDYLLKFLTIKNSLSTLSHAENHNYIELRDKARKKIETQFSEIIKTDEFLKASKNQIVKLFKSDDLNIKDETKVFQAALTWLNHRPESRKEHFHEILACVRLAELDAQYFMQEVESNQYIQKSASCQKIMLEARMFHMMGKEPESDMDEDILRRFRARKCNEFGELVVLVSGSDRAIGGWSLPFVEAFDTRRSEWYTLSKFPAYVKHGYACCGFKNTIMISGGKTISRDVWQYKLSDDAWSKISELNVGRFSHSMTALDGSVYVFGGIDNRQKRIMTVERFDMFKNKWLCDIPDIPVSVIDAKPVAIKKHIYLLGGQNEDSEETLVQCYNVKTKVWVKIECPKSVPSKFTSVVGLKGSIYGVGDGSVWRYQPSIDTWKKLKLDLEVVEGFSLAVANGRVMISGGKLPNPEVPEKPDDADDFDMVTSSNQGSVCGSLGETKSNEQLIVRDLISFNPDTEEVTEIAILTRPLWNHHSVTVKRKEESVLSKHVRGGFDQLADDISCRTAQIGYGDPLDNRRTPSVASNSYSNMTPQTPQLRRGYSFAGARDGRGYESGGYGQNQGLRDSSAQRRDYGGFEERHQQVGRRNTMDRTDRGMSSERMSDRLSGYDRHQRMASPPNRGHIASPDHYQSRPYSRTNGANYDSRQPIRPDNGSNLYTPSHGRQSSANLYRF